MVVESKEFSDRACGSALDKLAGMITTRADKNVIVFNPLARSRTDLVRLAVGVGPRFKLRNAVTGKTKHMEVAIPSCVTDLLTGVFYASSQPMELGHSFVIPVAEAMRVVPVTMKVEGREEVKTPLGVFKTLRVQPTAGSGVVKNRGNIWIWYTDDERHLPVQMRARLFLGTITFRLTANEYK